MYWNIFAIISLYLLTFFASIYCKYLMASKLYYVDLKKSINLLISIIKTKLKFDLLTMNFWTLIDMFTCLPLCHYRWKSSFRSKIIRFLIKLIFKWFALERILSILWVEIHWLASDLFFFWLSKRLWKKVLIQMEQ